MNNDLTTDIQDVLAGSPAVIANETKKKIEPLENTTLVTGTGLDVATNEPQQLTTTPTEGISFDEGSEEVYAGGTALPTLDYKTRNRADDGSEGSTLFFEPNYQPVVPYDIDTRFGTVKTDTLDRNKLTWQIAVNQKGYPDADWMGYLKVPDIGRESIWSKALTGLVGFAAQMPNLIAQGTYNVGSMVLRSPATLLGNVLKGTVVGDTLGAISDNFVNLENAVNDYFNKSNSGISQYFTGDPTDTSLRNTVSKAIPAAMLTVGAGMAASNPKALFTVLNFAGANQMREDALQYGLSPLASDAFALGGAGLMSKLDMLGYESMIGVGSLAARGAIEYLRQLEKGFGYRLAKTIGREATSLGVEAATEMGQETIQGFFDPEFRDNPTDRLAVAGIAAFGAKAVTLPASLRYAKAQDQAKLAKAMGLASELAVVRQAGIDLVDGWVKDGKLPAEMRDAVVDDLIKNAPDIVVGHIQEGIVGQLDKIPLETRKQFAKQLSSLDAKAVSKQQFDELEARVQSALETSKVKFSEEDANLIKGIMYGVAQIRLLADGTLPSQIKIPSFITITEARKMGYNLSSDVAGAHIPDINAIAIKQGLADQSNKTVGDTDVPYEGLANQDVTSRSSLKTEVILHELAHYLDRQVGDGYGEFLQNYYAAIKQVFGEARAESVEEEATKSGNRRNKSPIDYESTRNTTEHFAQAVQRLGKEAGRALGLSDSKAQQFASYANVMLNQMNAFVKGKSPVEAETAIDRFQDSLNEVISANNRVLDELIQAYGTEELQQAVRDFMNQKEYGFGDFLAQREMLQDLYDVVDSFMDKAGMQKVSSIFDGVSPQSFVERGQLLFESGFEKSLKPAKQKAIKQKTESAPNPVDSKTNDLPIVNTDVDTVIINKEAKKNIKAEMGMDEKDSINPFEIEVNGKTLEQNLTDLSEGLSKREVAAPNKFMRWALSRKWMWGIDNIIHNLFGAEVAQSFDLAGKYADKQTFRNEYWQKFFAKIDGLLGKGDKKTAFDTINNTLATKRVKGVEIINPITGIKNVKDLTGWEAMYVYLTVRQGDKFRARIQMSTTADLDVIMDSLTAEEKQLGDMMSETLQDMYKEYVSSKYIKGDPEAAEIEKVFKELGVYNYFPLMSAVHALYNETGIDSYKHRTDTTDAISIEDAGAIFSRAINRYASGKSGFFATVKRLRTALQFRGATTLSDAAKLTFDSAVEEDMIKQSAGLAQRIAMLIGKDGYQNLLNNLDYFLQNNSSEPISHSAFNKIANNFTKNFLAYNPLSLVKNMTNIASFWGGASNQGRYWNNFASGLSNPAQTWKWMMDNVVELRNRHGGVGIDEHLDQMAAGGSAAPLFQALANIDFMSDYTGSMAKMAAVMERMNELGLKIFMKNGDAIANVFGGYALMQDYMAQGMSVEEAARKLTRYINERQSSSNLVMKPLTQLEANQTIASQLFAFTTEGVAKWSSIIRGFDSVKMGDADTKSAVMNMLSIGSSMLLFALISAGAVSLFSDDEDAKEAAQEALLLEVMSQMFSSSIYGNPVITQIVQNAFGLSRPSGLSTPAFSFLSDFSDDIRDADYVQAIAKGMSAMGIMVGAPRVFNSIEGGMMMTSDDADVREAGKLMLIGRSPYYAEKRTGYEKPKETVEKDEE